MTSREIAEKLTLANNSVRWYIHQIYSKLGVNGKRAAIQQARELGLLAPIKTSASQDPQKSDLVFPASTASPATARLPIGTVTFLFTDIEGSTALWESQPEKMVEALKIHETALCQAIETHEGVVFKIGGDAIQAAFPTALQALEAAIEGQRALQAAPWNDLGQLIVRMGIHTGEAQLDPCGKEYTVSHTKNRTARIMSAAHGGQILLSQATVDLVDRQLPAGVTLKDLGENHLKGLSTPERLFQVCAIGLPGEFPPLATAFLHPHNLPAQLTSFVGRRVEIEEIKALLQEHPLVTLTGSGGVGKTRISIQVARELLEGYPDGAWLVELAPVSDPDQVPRTIANTFNLREDPSRPILETLVDFLRRKQSLILLDNCEHLLLACIDLADRLLSDCPQLKLLASSREALGIAGEIAYRVPSLSFPDPRQLPTVGQFLEYPAVRLFIERANVVMPGFKVTDKNTPAIARICQRLDGIPLAIELAAARLNLLTTEQLASRLENAFRLLTGGSRNALPRHQTLRATIDWSYDLLSDPERMLLRRLAVFAGSCFLEAAEAVCAGEGIVLDDILDLLSSLANKSILLAERKQGEDTRYRLLETVRQYAREKLFDARESASLRDRHLDYYLSLAEQAEPQLRGAGRLVWTKRLRIEMDNLRSAIEWAYQQEGSAQKGLRLVTAIGFRFLNPDGYLIETVDWLLKGLELWQNQTNDPILQVRVFNLLGEIYDGQRNYPALMECVQKILPILPGLSPSAYPDLIWALWNYAYALQVINETGHAIEVLDESIQISRQMGPAGAWYLGMSLFSRSILAFGEGDRELPKRLALECKEAFLISGDRWSLMLPYMQLGLYEGNRNEFLKALQYFQDAIVLTEEIGDRRRLLYIKIHLGRIQRKLGNYPEAILLHTDYVRLGETMGIKGNLNDGFAFLAVDWICLGKSISGAAQKDTYQRAIRLVAIAEWQQALHLGLVQEREIIHEAIGFCQHDWGEAEYQRVWEQGKSMSLDEAIAFALVLPEP